MRRISLLISSTVAVVLLPLASAAGSALDWQELVPAVGLWKNQRLVVLENDLVSVTFLPAAGGRLVRYVDKATALNHLQENGELTSEGAGGVWDKEGTWPTTNISNHPFAHRVLQSADRLEAVFEAHLGNLKIVRKCRLASHSTRLAVETTYQNTGPLPMRYLIAQVFHLAPGGTTGKEDYILYPDGDGVVKRAFGSRWSEGRHPVLPSWWLAGDSKRRESLLVTLEPNPLLAEHTIQSQAGAWVLELHSRRRLAERGETVTFRWDMHLIKGTSDLARVVAEDCFLPKCQWADMIRAVTPLMEGTVTFLDVDEHLLCFPWGLASLSVSDPVARQPHPLEVTLRLMRPAKMREASATPAQFGLWVDGKRVTSIPSKGRAPDAAEVQHIAVDTVGLEVCGRHSLRLAGEGQERAKMLRAKFAVIDEQDIGQRIERAQKAGAELAQNARRSGDQTLLAAAASCAMRAEDARRKFIMGPAFEEWGNSAHATNVNRLPLKLHPETRPADVDYLLRVLYEAERWIDALRGGRDPFRDRKGLFQKAFYSRVDGSLQPYTIFVPANYDGRKAKPLIILLHGSGGDQWEIPQAAANLDGRSVFAGALEEKPIEPNYLLCAPLARGPSAYLHVAEVDLQQMLDEIERDYRVDANRIYATGWSMGGQGAFMLASRFPQRLAAILPVAGSTDTAWIANARQVPCWNFHGLGDMDVGTGYLNVTENAYRSLGLPYHDGLRERPFVWGPWADHWVGYRMCGSFDEMEKILGEYRRVETPKRVSLLTPELRHNRAYWLQIDSFDRYCEPASLKAEIEGNAIAIGSENIGRFTLFLSDKLVDMHQDVRVVLNGRPIFAGKPAAELHLGPRTAQAGIGKAHGLSGPLSDLYYEPFLIVTATQGHDLQAIKAARREAEAIRDKGLRGVRFYDVPLKTDREITADDIDKYHLLLVGTPQSNLLLGRIQQRLPVRVEDGAVIAGDRRFPGDDVGFRLIYPNPLNPRKYVVVCAGVTDKGLEGLGSITAPNWGWNTAVSEPDLLIADQRSRGLYPRYLAALTFNGQWQWEDRGAVLGHLDVPLLRTGMECSWGNFRADAIREATGADIALVEVDDHFYPLELAVGDVTRGDLLMANNGSPVYTFAATGAQLRRALEHMIERVIQGTTEPDWYGTVRRPVAVSGLSYAFHRDSPQGQRIDATSLHPDKLYQVAVTEHVLSQSSNGVGFGYLGWLPKIHRTPFNEVRAQTLYLHKRGVLKQVTLGRITER